MRILYANVIGQRAGWGAEYFVNRAFHRLCHATVCVDYRQHRSNLAAVFARIADHDVFFLQHGDGFSLELVRALHGPRIYWASEPISRCRDQDALLQSGLFDHVFFHSRACLDMAVAQGWIPRDRGSVLLNGFDQHLHRPNGSIAKDIDILFDGFMTARRKRWLDELQTRFRVHLATAYDEELASLIHRSKIVLNLHAEDFLDTETRVFEILGSGGFLLTERLSADNPFNSGHLAEFATLDELCRKAAYYLEHEGVRLAISVRGYEEAVLKHTYTHRAAQIAGAMDKLLAEQGRELPYRIVSPSVISGIYRFQPEADPTRERGTPETALLASDRKA